MKNILFIAGMKEQYYFAPFLEACENIDVNIHICDPSRYPQEASICATQSDNGHMDGYIDTVQIHNGSVKESRISLSSIDTAWYLRENYVENPYKIPTTINERFSENETRQALRAVFSTLECKWINKRESIEYVNSNKFYQQMIASRCGLLVPQTIISNNPESVQKFSDSNNGILAKPIGYTKLDDEGRLALYSECFSVEEVTSSHKAIRICPLYGQKYVDKLYEHRVMAIGSSILSCRIDSQASEKTKVDWRHYDLENTEHKYVELPEVVRKKLLSFMSMIDLRYGAIDLIETPDGNFVFLEINPSGQWGWINTLAGLPIPEAVAQMLYEF